MKKQIIVILLVTIALLTSCQQAPSVQPWEQNATVSTPSNTAKINDAVKASPIPSSTSTTESTISPNAILLPPRDCILKELKETTPKTVQMDIKGKERLVHVNANVSLITGQSENCPILSAKPRIYDWKKIGKMIYGDKMEEAYKYNEEAKKHSDPNDKDTHCFLFKNQYLTVSNDSHIVGEAFELPKWNEYDMFISTVEHKYTQVEKVNENCDKQQMTKEEAIKKAGDSLRKYELPIDYEHLDVTAVEITSENGILQYYRLYFPYTYNGLLLSSMDVYTTEESLSLNQGFAEVNINDEGIRFAVAKDSPEFTEVQHDVKVISIEKAIESFKKYVDYINPADPAKEVSYDRIKFNYIAVLKKGSKTEVLYYPSWIFMSTTYRQNDVTINAVDGTIVSSGSNK